MQGYTTFDNTALAFVSVFQTVTCATWDYIMFITGDALGTGAYLYFLIILLIGSFGLLQLVLAVFSSAFADMKHTVSGECCVVVGRRPLITRLNHSFIHSFILLT